MNWQNITLNYDPYWVFKIFYNHGEPTIFAHLILAFCICHMVILLRD